MCLAVPPRLLVRLVAVRPLLLLFLLLYTLLRCIPAPATVCPVPGIIATQPHSYQFTLTLPRARQFSVHQ